MASLSVFLRLVFGDMTGFWKKELQVREQHKPDDNFDGHVQLVFQNHSHC